MVTTYFQSVMRCAVRRIGFFVLLEKDMKNRLGSFTCSHGPFSNGLGFAREFSSGTTGLSKRCRRLIAAFPNGQYDEAHEFLRDDLLILSGPGDLWAQEVTGDCTNRRQVYE